MHQQVEYSVPIKVYAMIDKKLALWEVSPYTTHVDAIQQVKDLYPNSTVLALIK